MFRLLLLFVALLCSLAVLLTGSGLLGTLLAVRMGVEGLPPRVIGSVMACYSIGFVVATLVCERIIQKVGHIRAFAAFAAIAAGSTLVYPLFVNAWVWGAMRGVFGFSLAGLYMLAESWFNDRTPREYRAQMLAFYAITTYAGQGGGQFLLNLYPVTGYELFSIAAFLFAVALVPVALTRAPSPQIVQARPVGLGRLYDISPLGLAGSASAGMINGAFMAMGPVFAQGVGFSLASVSVLMGGTVLGGLLLQWPLGKLADLYDRRWTMFWVAVSVALCSTVIAVFAGDSLSTVVVLAVLWGGFAFTIYPLSVAIANDFVAPDELVGLAAGLLMVHGVGMIIGPLGAAALMETIGPVGLFWGVAAVAGSLALFAYYRHQVGTPIVAEEQTGFRSMPVTSTAHVAVLDPRSDEHQLEFDFGHDDEEEFVENLD